MKISTPCSGTARLVKSNSKQTSLLTHASRTNALKTLRRFKSSSTFGRHKTMLPDKKVMCPYTGFQKSCWEGVAEHSCPKWIHIMGSDPNTGQAVDKYG